MTDGQLEFCTFVEQVFLQKGELPNFEVIQNALGLTRRETINLWNSSTVKGYLRDKGIDFARINGEVLSPIQLLAINQILDYNDTRPDHRKLKDLGISLRTYQAWKADPAFLNYLKTRVDRIVGENTDEIDRALFDAARSGDMQAIKFINEFTGRYRGTSSNAIDVQTVIIKITEILTRHLATDHPSVLEAIGRELQLLSTQGVAAPQRPSIKGELL